MAANRGPVQGQAAGTCDVATPSQQVSHPSAPPAGLRLPLTGLAYSTPLSLSNWALDSFQDFLILSRLTAKAFTQPAPPTLHSQVPEPCMPPILTPTTSLASSPALCPTAAPAESWRSLGSHWVSLRIIHPARGFSSSSPLLRLPG